MTYPAPTPPSPPAPVPPRDYPTLRLSDEIQGNVLAGFRKDRQQLLFVSFDASTANARAWLAEILPRIATTRQVASFK